MKLSDKTYDLLKWIALYFLPALGTLYFAVASIWNLPYGEEIVGTITALDTFIAVIIGISKTGYQGDGQIMIDTSGDETEKFRIVIDDDALDALKDKKYASLKIDNKADLSDMGE